MKRKQRHRAGNLLRTSCNHSCFAGQFRGVEFDRAIYWRHDAGYWKYELFEDLNEDKLLGNIPLRIGVLQAMSYTIRHPVVHGPSSKGSSAGA